MTADPREEEDAARPGALQLVLVALLAIIGLGVAAFEVLGLSPDEIGGTPLILGGAGVLILLLPAILRR
jgi:hypothetical protein